MARGVALHCKGRRYDCSLISFNSTGIELAAKSESGTSYKGGKYTCLFLTEESGYVVLGQLA